MAPYYFDSSALVKRYVAETGTPWVRGLTRRDTGKLIYIARITIVEVTSAIARRRRGATFSRTQASSILSRFRKHVAGRYTILEVTTALLADATKLANAHDLRAYDAIQLAAAIEVNRFHRVAAGASVDLISADRELNSAAAAEGLSTDDPNTHS